jgi:hypothetical protein
MNILNPVKPTGFILLGLLISAGIMNAQTDFRPGYIIKTNGDTLVGQVDYRGDLLMSILCRFKAADNTISEYPPEDILAFRFVDSKYFVTKEINNKKRFMEYLIKGKISIYYMRDENGDHYYLDKDDVGLIEIPYEEGTKYVDGKKVFYESTRHIGILNYYMQDAPDLQSVIRSVKKPEHQNLIKLAEDYHNAVCKGEKCIIYERSLPFIKILPELTGGVIRYSDVRDLDERFYMHVGIIGHLWIPRTSEKMYFRTGILFSQLDFDDGKTNFYKIPCQLEYIYPKGILRPRIAYGFNFYLPNSRTVSFDIGANLKLSETFCISATSDIEFSPALLIVPKTLLSYSLKLGLFVSIQ